jgi:Fe-S-cluster formation regulator IscX/YfhJ|tara:strand:+ start:1067 stop:1249 length:183 start_codon:yes stop_codon:yes gene_type:complete
MTTIQVKKEELQAELQILVDTYNETLTIQNQRKQRFVELQSAIKTLQEVDGDPNTTTEVT